MATEIRVPTIGVSATKASIGRWFKRVGEPVTLNEPLVEIETDGTTVEVPASATGVLSDILLTDGATVKSGSLLGTITEYGSDTKTPGAR
jgi:2-oxoglutarate dehydrogenase E2 component (dihydrolipoamide succinyltransferase)